VGLSLKAASDSRIVGPLNVVSPHAVTNAEFTRALSHAVGRPAFLPVPRLALRAIFGQMEQALTASQRVLSLRAESLGYRYRFPTLEAALAECLEG
jgi:NAD dependent epimerase/dehydratase family enzyme